MRLTCGDSRPTSGLRFIKGARRTGLTLRQIRELLEVIDRGLCPCGHAEDLVEARRDSSPSCKVT